MRVGSAPPAAAVAAGSGFAGGFAVDFAAGAGLGASLAASLAPFGAAPCACAREVTPHKAAPATRNVSIRNTDDWFPHHCDWKMARGRIVPPGWIAGKCFFGKALTTPPTTPFEFPFEPCSSDSGNGYAGITLSLWCGLRVAAATAHRSIAADPLHPNFADASRHPA